MINFNKFAKSLIIWLLFTYVLSTTAQTTVTFNYTGAVQSWTIPPCVTSIDVSINGAQGGGTNGGNGSSVTGTIPVTSGQVLQINVGGQGNCPAAGWNGGGVGAPGGVASCGGGGSSDIRITPYTLENRIVIASGGGGTGGGDSYTAGGIGGCDSGAVGGSSFGTGAGGGTQSAGGNGGDPWFSSGNMGGNGTLGIGGFGASDPCYALGPGGGGGGGYYGGGGGGSDCYSCDPLGGGGGGGGASCTLSGGTCV